MNKPLLHSSLLSYVHFTFSRSSGPGGQNVNKVNTKVYASMPITSLEGISTDEVALIRQKLQGHINQQDELYISVQEERSQKRNRERALLLLEQKLISALQVHSKRKKTKPSRGAKERRLKQKRIKSEKKQSRHIF